MTYKSKHKENDRIVLSPKVTKLMGVIKLPDNLYHKKVLGDILLKKYTQGK